MSHVESVGVHPRNNNMFGSLSQTESDRTCLKNRAVSRKRESTSEKITPRNMMHRKADTNRNETTIRRRGARTKSDTAAWSDQTETAWTRMEVMVFPKLTPEHQKCSRWAKIIQKEVKCVSVREANSHRCMQIRLNNRCFWSPSITQ